MVSNRAPDPTVPEANSQHPASSPHGVGTITLTVRSDDAAVIGARSEALTNVLNHAGRVATSVRVACSPPKRNSTCTTTVPRRPLQPRRPAEVMASSAARTRRRIRQIATSRRSSLRRLPSHRTNPADVTIRVVIADDQTLLRSGLAMILAAQPDIEVVAEAEDGNVAVDLVRKLRPDIVLMDIRMPGADGLSATRTIADDPLLAETRVVMLTAYDLDEYFFEALQAGAAGFLLKGVSPEDLVRGVREVAAGEGLLAPSATRRLITEFVNSRRTNPPDNEP